MAFWRMWKTTQGSKSFRIWSGLSESNRHLNLGKVSRQTYKRLNWQQLAALMEALTGKQLENKTSDLRSSASEGINSGQSSSPLPNGESVQTLASCW